ncbi:hypothetical protein CAter282_2372 [Collimonas arenae]|uniref:Uncharacterized protein n=1 Tax=Collimonas arenae TaxID=279058 RepID=A0A127QJ61_9BURK|nr:hypothetical protein [Collimonas arenae]AMP00241.1 hypothetical protein CAter10_2613 [Collimonas arenae]AMP10118.1 hypothetical protein CAter282_2372 [Collimonas arenae]
MPVNQFRISTATCQILLTLLVCAASSAAVAAGNQSEAVARYQAERAACNNGQSNESRPTCLKEAGAALQAARNGGLTSDQNAYNQNAMARCQPLPPDEQDACRRRINGEGTSSGSAQQGGILRELTVPDRK